MQILYIACETLQFYGSVLEVILTIHLISDEKIKVKSYKNQQNSVSEYTESFTLMISFLFSLKIINEFHKHIVRTLTCAL